MSQRFERRSVSMPTPMLEDLKAEAKERDLSLSQLVRHYLRNGGLGQHRDALDLKREREVDGNDNAAH